MWTLFASDASSSDSGNSDDTAENEAPIVTESQVSFALLVLVILLMTTLCISYQFQKRRIRILHETVVGIFLGETTQRIVSFDSKFFFNLLLPPILLHSGYELQINKFLNQVGSITTFAVFGTVISAFVIGAVLKLALATGMHGLNWSWLDCTMFGAILSSTDPVTILAIFRQLKVEPKLYTVIFGETMLNDAVAIVLYETLKNARGHDLTWTNLMGSIGHFISVSLGSSLIGIVTALLGALVESCAVILIAYAAYLVANAAGMSGIVSLLLFSIILKHYVYPNLSLRTKRTTRYMVAVMAHLSENFIFVYLGLTVFTQKDSTFYFGLVLFTFVATLLGRAIAVFPLSRMINYVVKQNVESPNFLPEAYQVMLFWAGLRGAVAFALALDVGEGVKGNAMLSTTLFIVTLSVIAFGGSTTRMLEKYHIETGVDEDRDATIGRRNGRGAIPRVRSNWFTRMNRSYVQPFFISDDFHAADGRRASSGHVLDLRNPKPTLSNIMAGGATDNEEEEEEEASDLHDDTDSFTEALDHRPWTSDQHVAS